MKGFVIVGKDKIAMAEVLHDNGNTLLTVHVWGKAVKEPSLVTLHTPNIAFYPEYTNVSGYEPIDEKGRVVYVRRFFDVYTERGKALLDAKKE